MENNLYLVIMARPVAQPCVNPIADDMKSPLTTLQFSDVAFAVDIITTIVNNRPAGTVHAIIEGQHAQVLLAF